MSTYFFHLQFARNHVEDPEGTELPDLEAAKTEAKQILRDLVAERLRAPKPSDLYSIRICNEDGKLLAEVPVAEAILEIIPAHIFKSSPT